MFELIGKGNTFVDVIPGGALVALFQSKDPQVLKVKKTSTISDEPQREAVIAEFKKMKGSAHLVAALAKAKLPVIIVG